MYFKCFNKTFNEKTLDAVVLFFPWFFGWLTTGMSGSAPKANQVDLALQ